MKHIEVSTLSYGSGLELSHLSFNPQSSSSPPHPPPPPPKITIADTSQIILEK